MYRQYLNSCYLLQRQNITGCCQQTFENKNFVDMTQKCFALLPQVNFPDNNLNFHWRWRWWDWIQAIFLKLFYFTWNSNPELTLHAKPVNNGNGFIFSTCTSYISGTPLLPHAFQIFYTTTDRYKGSFMGSYFKRVQLANCKNLKHDRIVIFLFADTFIFILP